MNSRWLVLLAVGLLGCPQPVEPTDCGPTDGGYTCTVEVIDADGGGAKTLPYVSLALDSAGAPQVAFYDFTRNSLHHASRGASGWTHEQINGQGDGGSQVRLRLSSSGKAHLSYYNSTASAVIYATNTSGSWVFEQVAPNAGSSSLALDSTGAPRIVYARNSAPKSLQLGTRAGTTWSSAEIDPALDLDQPSFRLDAAGKGHVSYIDRTSLSLKYATDVSGAWVIQTIDSPDVGSGSALALDPAGKVHVTYFDPVNGKLKHATNASGAWIATTIEAAGTVGGNGHSLAIDSAGHLHLTYYQATVRDLGYATNRSGAWVAMPLVAGPNDLGNASSLAVDSTADVLHAAFADRTTGFTRYVSCRR